MHYQCNELGGNLNWNFHEYGKEKDKKCVLIRISEQTFTKADLKDLIGILQDISEEID